MNILIKPRTPDGSEPSRDEDPTGVRALLSSLPEPDPMPDHLVERITASLAAEQAQRAAAMSGASVSPLLATSRRRTTQGRRTRLLSAIVGAAAVVALLAVVATTMFTVHQPTTATSSAALSGRLSTEASGAAPQGSADKAVRAPGVASAAQSPSLVQIGLSGTRYTLADFATQARALRFARLAPFQPPASGSSSVGALGTTPGILECLSAIGAAQAQLVMADVAFYDRMPAVIIVATTNGVPVAYVVGRGCSRTDARVLRAATPLS